jgi:hypothetical protein
MCDYCKDILSFTHLNEFCPLKRVQYCSYCASYGHNEETCKNICRDYPILREKTSMNITKENDIQVYEILNNTKAIRAFLKVFNDLPRKEIRDKEKYRKHLKEFEKRRNVKVVLYNIVE